MYFGSAGLAYLQIPLWSASSGFDISPGYPRTDESFSKTICIVLDASQLPWTRRKYTYDLGLFEDGRWASLVKRDDLELRGDVPELFIKPLKGLRTGCKFSDKLLWAGNKGHL